MRVFIFGLMMIWMPFEAYSQSTSSQKIDSLNQQLKMAKADTTRVHLLCQLSGAYGKIDSLLTFRMGFEALDLSRKINYQKGIADALITLGGGYMDYFEIEEAEAYILKGLVEADRLLLENPSRSNTQLWLKGTYFLAVNYGYKGEDDKELELTLKVIPVAERINDQVFLANVFTNLGIKNLNLGEHEDAYKSFMKSGVLNKSLNKPEKIIFDRLSFALLLYEMDSIPKMKSVLDEVRPQLEKLPDAPDWYLYHARMGLYYTGIKRYDKALASLEEARHFATKNKMHQELYVLSQQYAFVYEQMGDYKNAVNAITDFLEVAKKNGIGLDTFKGYYKRSQFEAADGHYESAYQDLDLALTIYDSLETLKKLDQIKDLELKYATREKEMEILTLKNENSEAALTLEKNKSRSYLMIGIIFIMGFLGYVGYLFYNLQLKKARKKERIKEAEVQLLKQEQQNRIFSAMIEGQEKERKRLAIDLHDGLGGRLSGISLHLSKLDRDEPKAYPKEQLQKVMQDLNDSLAELRGIARNMMPETLVKFGLQAALKDYCSSMNGSNTKVSLQFYGSEKGILPNQQVTLYRVIQELINNAVKHARASEVLVQYIRDGNTIDITVEDNGVGFSKEILESDNPGMGFSNLQTRVAYLNGNMDFQSQLNQGTTVNIQVTIDAA